MTKSPKMSLSLILSGQNCVFLTLAMHATCYSHLIPFIKSPCYFYWKKSGKYEAHYNNDGDNKHCKLFF